MTQDYEPVEFTESTPEPKEDGLFLIYENGTAVVSMLHDSAFEPTHTWLCDGYWEKWSHLAKNHSPREYVTIQSLAAHDAQIRAEERMKALELSNSEQKIFAKAVFESLGKYGFFYNNFYDRDEPYETTFTEAANGHFGFDAIEAGIKAVNQFRETTSEEVQQ